MGRKGTDPRYGATGTDSAERRQWRREPFELGSRWRFFGRNGGSGGTDPVLDETLETSTVHRETGLRRVEHSRDRTGHRTTPSPDTDHLYYRSSRYPTCRQTPNGSGFTRTR